jgi:hypothetical protein
MSSAGSPREYHGGIIPPGDNLTIATGNDNDFRRPGIKVFNPFKEHHTSAHRNTNSRRIQQPATWRPRARNSYISTSHAGEPGTEGARQFNTRLLELSGN